MTAEGEDYLVIEDEECYNVLRDDATSWVVDSCVSFHITSYNKYLTYYIGGGIGQMRMGNKGIVGKGVVCIETDTVATR